MFKEYIYQNSPAKFNNRIRIIDVDSIDLIVNYAAVFAEHNFKIIKYSDDLSFRIGYEEFVKENQQKCIVITKPGDYFPYDLQGIFTNYELSYERLFPRLNREVVAEKSINDFDFFVFAYNHSYENMKSEAETEAFINTGAFEYAGDYLELTYKNLINLSNSAKSYKDWFEISRKKAKADILAESCDYTYDYSEIDACFKSFILKDFGKLSGVTDSKSPVLINRAMEYMRDNSSKYAVIVMDGMSAFDWNILRKQFNNIVYEYSNAFAMIPTTTSISRQCLLSNKFPKQLENPWSQNKEKKEFENCAINMGYTNLQIAYERGYDISFDMTTQCGAIIINDIDDIVHGQKQGRKGMLRNIEILVQEAKLRTLVDRLIHDGFDVYITSDHGNTESVGVGLLKGTGVLVETKSRKMLVLKEFADKDKWKEEFGMIEYPKYYLPKEYDYLICDVGISMDVKGERVMTHGGISMDEVIVPFIKIRAEDNR